MKKKLDLNPATDYVKYLNGYMPKIEHWQAKFDEAKRNNDFDGMNEALDSLIYFVSKQKLIYG